jgi:hypothetical protein
MFIISSDFANGLLNRKSTKSTYDELGKAMLKWFHQNATVSDMICAK